jgi:SEC-C motif
MDEYRRNVIVFSESLSALTIEHGGKTSSGPDILVSYHDNDHYNSVRDIRLGKPPPVIKTFVKSETGEMSAESHDEPIHQEAGELTVENPHKHSEEDKSSQLTDMTCTPQSDDSEEEEDAAAESKPRSKAEKKLQKNSPCHCGSGIKYKKCCRSQDKAIKRKRHVLRSNSSMDDNRSQKSHELDGAFRVLKI